MTEHNPIQPWTGNPAWCISTNIKKLKGLDHEAADKLIKEHGELLTANCNMMHIIKENERRIEQILSELKFLK